ncbi:bifunctional riboflavin kinase/FAD synthetase [Candidatus Dependentiae bacterium]|nr:bifunctional riboflavin kinase/FAD synthetase [Candidatus Dependentiae bacterium]
MKIFETLKNLEIENKTAVTIGVFDGIHLGHQELLKKVVEISFAAKCKPAVITFQTNPKLLFNNHNNLYSGQLISFQNKKKMLEKIGIEYLINFKSDEPIFEYSAESFISEILIKTLKTEFIVIGYDFRFGKEKKGNNELLTKYFKENVINVKKIVLNGKTVSSSNIKKCLINNNISFANQMLGYKYGFSGIVKKGKRLGRTIGFPTINIDYPENIIQLSGVYESSIIIRGKLYKSISHIGEIPTFNESKKVIETFVMDFNETVYDEKVTVFPERFIRKIIKFNSIDELKKQIIIDVNIIKN